MIQQECGVIMNDRTIEIYRPETVPEFSGLTITLTWTPSLDDAMKRAIDQMMTGGISFYLETERSRFVVNRRAT